MAAKTNSGPLNVAVIGGGLVGALNACFLAKRGFQVDLYEFRDDIRLLEHVPGRSINLALSVRGIQALSAVGLDQTIVHQHGIPMKGRMIHSLDGKMKFIPYGNKDQCIYSVGRRHLNETLLNAAESFPNVTVHFQHKLVSAELQKGKLNFQVGESKTETEKSADLIVGNDGAHSVVRREMTKLPNFNYSQTYIEHGYLELCIPPTQDEQFAMPANYLHIWPRGTYMMIALPNQDKSWTVTLFMPFDMFQNVNSPSKLLQFFECNYPDAIPLIGKTRLIKDFFAAKPSPLMSVKCRPYHVEDKIVIMGDAAHAMVPFYGQGMNAGFEDTLIFDGLLEKHNNNLAAVLPEFSTYRNPDAEAICDLAMYNYIEMRHLVNSNMFLMRNQLDKILSWIFPNRWFRLYSMVTFSRKRYHECVEQKSLQDKILKQCLILLVLFILLNIFFLFYV